MRPRQDPYWNAFAERLVFDGHSRRVAPVKQDLVELIALLEAGIDFAEDDVEVTAGTEIAQRIATLTRPLAARLGRQLA